MRRVNNGHQRDCCFPSYGNVKLESNMLWGSLAGLGTGCHFQSQCTAAPLLKRGKPSAASCFLGAGIVGGDLFAGEVAFPPCNGVNVI